MLGIGGSGLSAPGVAGVPVPSFTSDKVSGAPTLTVAFTDTSTGSPTSWVWEFGDGTSSTAHNPTHDYIAAGFYTVTLTAYNANGDATIRRPGYIHVEVAPVANFIGDPPLSGPDPLSVVFEDQSTGRFITAWHWEKNDSSGWVDFDGDPTAQNPTEIFTVGDWDVRLTVTNVGGSNTKTRLAYIHST